MPPKTTVVIILFAGNSDTTDQLDPLLKELQDGLKSMTEVARPDVYCFYLRHSDPGRSFKVGTSTPTFDMSGHLIDLTTFPPPGMVTYSGNLNSQVTAFLTSVGGLLPTSGPVHVIIGGHGVPAWGFHPVRFVKLLIALILSPFNRQLKGLPWLARFRQLRNRLFMIGQPLGAIASGSNQPDLTLDQTATALQQLTRLTSIIIHSCNLSAIETMCALHAAPHHIGCETELSGQMKISEWFATLADPASTWQQITDACFDSIQNGDSSSSTDPLHADGCFSSHSVDHLPLLEKLNQLGAQLEPLVNSNPAVEAAILSSQSQTLIQYSVDVIRFCEILASSASSPALPTACQDSAKAVADFVSGLQLRVQKTSSDPLSSLRKGISIYLPERKNQFYAPNLLPESLRSGAPEWYEFVKTWGQPMP